MLLRELGCWSLPKRTLKQTNKRNPQTRTKPNQNKTQTKTKPKSNPIPDQTNQTIHSPPKQNTDSLYLSTAYAKSLGRRGLPHLRKAERFLRGLLEPNIFSQVFPGFSFFPDGFVETNKQLCSCCKKNTCGSNSSHERRNYLFSLGSMFGPPKRMICFKTDHT